MAEEQTLITPDGAPQQPAAAADGEAQEPQTPEQAQAAIAELKRDGDFMRTWMHAHVPGHREAVERMGKLQRLALGHAGTDEKQAAPDDPFVPHDFDPVSGRYGEVDTDDEPPAEEYTDEHREAAEGRLRQRFGEHVEKRIEGARDFLARFGGSGAVQQIHDAGMANSVALTSTLAELDVEDRALGGQLTVELKKLWTSGMTSHDAAAELERMMGDRTLSAQLMDASKLSSTAPVRARRRALEIYSRPPKAVLRLLEELQG